MRSLPSPKSSPEMDPIVVQLATGIIGTLVLVIGVLWRDNLEWRRRWKESQDECQKKWELEHEKRIADLKEQAVASAMFTRALEKLQNKNSGPPNES